MKRSIKDGDPRTFLVRLNDRLQGDVAAADDVAGEIELFCHTREGKRIPNSDLPYGYETIICKGKISIVNGCDPNETAVQQNMEQYWGMCGFPMP